MKKRIVLLLICVMVLSINKPIGAELLQFGSPAQHAVQTWESSYVKDGLVVKETRTTISPSIDGAINGVAAGTVVGTFFGPWGAAAGAVIGGVIGFVFGPAD